jgi:hypothetical protein
MIETLVCPTPPDAAVTYRPRMVAPQFRFPAWLAGGELAVATGCCHIVWWFVDGRGREEIKSERIELRLRNHSDLTLFVLESA